MAISTTGQADSYMMQSVIKMLEKNIDITVEEVIKKYKKKAHEELNKELNKEKIKIALYISQMYDVEFDSNRVIINMKVHNEGKGELK